MIRITSKRAGFRRCGMPHPKEPVDYPDDRFSEEELDILMAESMLIVETGNSPPARKGLRPGGKLETETAPEPAALVAVFDIDNITVAQIKAELDALGVEYPDKAKKAEVFELYKVIKGGPE